MPATLTVEFPCDRHCSAELDLEGTHIRFTLGQMLAVVDRAHDEAHAADPVKVYRYRDEVLVRAVAGV